jgi:hypothetical protein
MSTINPVSTIEGKRSRRAASLVAEWAALHQEELARNWLLLRRDQPVEKIEPLE